MAGDIAQSSVRMYEYSHVTTNPHIIFYPSSPSTQMIMTLPPIDGFPIPLRYRGGSAFTFALGAGAARDEDPAAAARDEGPAAALPPCCSEPPGDMLRSFLIRFALGRSALSPSWRFFLPMEPALAGPTEATSFFASRSSLRISFAIFLTFKSCRF